MRAQRLITPVTLFLIAFFVVALPAERSRDFDGTISFLAGFATTVGMYAIFTLALNVQWGYTGVFNFGVAAFFMVGAYTAAIFTKSPADSEYVTYIGGFGEILSPPFLNSDQWLPFLVATAAAGLMSGLLALLLAVPTLRLREDYLAIATIGVAELLRRVTIQEDGLVNSNRGLIGIPRPFHDYFDPADYKFVYLAIVVVVLVLVFIAVERGIRSPWGRVLRALKEDEQAATASGKNVFAFKMQGFVLGAVIMGVGGAVFAYSRGSVGPATFEHFFATFLFWAMLIVGGSGNSRGAVAGAFVVWGLWTITLQLNGYDLPEVVRSRIFFIRDFVVGALIVAVLLLRPQGLFPEERRVSIWLDRQMRRQRRLPREPDQEAEA
jgi:branched-chain amino acid transport system permease protein